MTLAPAELFVDNRDFTRFSTILKVDVDYDFFNKKWLGDWIKTRKSILSGLGYMLLNTRVEETERGYHFWFTIVGEWDDRTKNKLQFLLGDDVTRVKINNNRIDRGVEEWNKLFSEVYWRQKKELDEKCKDCRVRRVAWGLAEDDKNEI